MPAHVQSNFRWNFEGRIRPYFLPVVAMLVPDSILQRIEIFTGSTGLGFSIDACPVVGGFLAESGHTRQIPRLESF